MSKFQIFRSGTRTDHNGNTVTITEADVAQAAAAYDPALNQAPIVVGHPVADAPAYGWVSGLSAEGGVLSADFAQVDDGFKELVRAGRYKKVSASFYPPEHAANPKPGVWYLRHVGFLGAAAPAVKGLQPVNFADDTQGIVEFSEAAPSEAVGLLRRLLRLFGAADFAEDAPAEAALPQPPTQPEQEHTMNLEAQLAAEKARREQAEAEVARLQAEQERSLRTAAHQANADFAEALVASGHLKPADKALVVQVLDFAEYPEHTTADFGEGQAKKPLAAALRDFLTAVLPQQFPGGETAKRSDAPAAAVSFAEYADAEELDLHQRASALAEKEGISFDQAVIRCMK